MRRTLKASMTAIVLSSVALVPMATIATVAASDAAFAKSNNAGGKGGGQANGGQAKAQKRSGGQSGSRSASGRGRGGGLGGLFDKLTGRDKAATRSAHASGVPENGSGMHPSERGNMNGALNANENAILAHIRNGNTNGPVGLMAAFAAADYLTADARALLDSDLAVEYAALSDALGEYDSYDAYRLAYLGNETDPGNPLAYDQNIEDAYAATSIDQATLDKAEYDAALDALVDYWNKGDADSDNVDDLRSDLMYRVAEYEGVGETVDALEPEAAEAEGCEGVGPCAEEDMPS